MLWPDAYTEPDPCPVCGRRNCLDGECDAIRHAESSQLPAWDDLAAFEYDTTDVDWLEMYLDSIHPEADTDTLPF